MKAFITGINGQDGSYLTEHLLSLGYEVHGIIRRNSVCEHQQSRIEHVRDKIQVYYGDVTDTGCLYQIMGDVQPDEIYNLAAQSHVRISADVPQFTAQVNAIGALNVLDTYKKVCPHAKFYQASSSEMFGNNVDEDNFQRENTPMHPVSAYGCAKLFAYSSVRYYRRAFKLFACNGILFNHESPRRGSNFVTNKIVQGAVAIKKGLQDKLELGNMDSHRDWGHSKDYCINTDVPILTPAGWKFQEDINAGDKVINFDPVANRLTTDTVLAIHSFNSDGHKIRLLGRGVDLVVTPEHTIFYQRKSSKSKGGWTKWKTCTAKEFHEMISNLSTRTKYNFRLPHFDKYDGDEYPVSDSVITLLGALAAEGCIGNTPGALNISISQSFISNESMHKEIQSAINDCKLEANPVLKNNGVTEWRFSAESSRKILEWYQIPNIHILPRYVFSFSARQAKLLMDVLMQCDGCVGTNTYSSKRSLLAVDFQTIAHISGRRTTEVKQQKDGIYTVCVISPSKSSYSWIQSTEEINDNKPNTWCVTTNNGTIISRDSGTIAISGNCRAMHKILNHHEPDDFVISTGQTHSIRDLCEYVFGKLDLDYKNYVIQNPKYMRPEELKYLKGDSTKARTTLNWVPNYTFETLLDEMVEFWMEK